MAGRKNLFSVEEALKYVSVLMQTPHQLYLLSLELTE